jgi:hypothetical protein
MKAASPRKIGWKAPIGGTVNAAPHLAMRSTRLFCHYLIIFRATPGIS